MIHKLAGEGIRNIKEMERASHLYVKMELFEREAPPPINQPTFLSGIERDRRNHMHDATVKLAMCKVDNLAIKT